MKVISLLTIVFVGSLLCSGCSGRGDGGGGDTIPETGNYTKSEALLYQEQCIDEMGEKPWSKTEYENIKKEQIPNLDLDSEKGSASDYLNAVYVNVMVRDAGNILRSGCGSDNAHATLNAILSELSGFDTKNVKGILELNSMKKIHDEASKFANQGVPYQSVNSFVSYDRSYEASHKGEAKKHLDNGSLKCKHIRAKLESLTRDEAYLSRRRNYCQQITDLYLRQTSDVSQSTCNRVKGLLVAALSESATGALRAKIDNHYRELNMRKN